MAELKLRTNLRQMRSQISATRSITNERLETDSRAKEIFEKEQSKALAQRESYHVAMEVLIYKYLRNA